MSLENLTTSDVLIALLVIFLVCEGIKTIGGAIETVKKWKSPRETIDATVKETLADHGKKLDNDKRMLDRHDGELADIRQGQRSTCRGVQALLEHELHNGNADDMKEASDEINRWLLERK